MPATFNGTHYLSRSNADVCPTADATIVGWAKTSTAPTQTRNVVAFGSSSSDTPIMAYRYRDNNSARARVFWRENLSSLFYSYAGLLHFGQWHPFMVRRSGNTLTLSIAGVVAGESREFPVNSGFEGDTTVSGSPVFDRLAIGELVRATATDNVFVGEIAEVAVFNRALSDAENLVWMRDGFPERATFPAGLSTTGLLAYYPLDATNTVNDVSGNARHLTASGANVTFSDASDLYTDAADVIQASDPTNPVIDAEVSGDTLTLDVRTVVGRQVGVAPVMKVSDPPSTNNVRVHGLNIDDSALKNKSAQLANKASDYFSHPAFFFPKIARQAIYLQSSGATGDGLHGYEINTGSDFAGVVESRGAATHCWPLATKHDDDHTYRVHPNGNYDTWLSRDGQPFKIDWPIIESITDQDTNEEYHCGAAVVSVPGQGIICFQCPHNEVNGWQWLAIPTASLDGLGTSGQTSPVTAAASRVHTYVHADVDAAGNAWVMSRTTNGGTGMCVLYKITDPFGTPSYTTYFLGLLRYPRMCRVMSASDGTDLLAISHHDRPAESFGDAATMFVFDPATETVYNLAGDSFDASATTSGSPCLSGANRDAATSSGGVRVTAAASGDQVYVPDGVEIDLSAWEDSAGNRKARSFVPLLRRLASSVSDPKNDYATTGDPQVWHIEVYDGVAGSLYDHSLPAAFADTNSHRQSIALRNMGDGVVVGMFTDRGFRSENGLYDEVPFTLYYDWGGEALVPFRVSDAFTSSPTYTTFGRRAVRGSFPAGFMTTVQNDSDRVHIQDVAGAAVVEVHRQMMLSTRSLSSLTSGTLGRLKYGVGLGINLGL